MHKVKLSLTNYTAIAFSAFLFITISILISISYNRMSQMSQDAVSQQFQRYVDDIYTSVSYKYRPITQLFGYLSTSSDWDREQATDISLIKAIDLTRYLAKDALTNSIYMGFPNGDFLGAHKLVSTTKKYYYDAPDTAKFVIETLIFKQAKTNKLTRVYLNKEFSVIDTTIIENDSLNIFERPWYKIGTESTKLIPIPVYKDLRTNESSLTLVQKHQFSDIVIATDLNLNTIVNSLKASDLSNDAIRVLFGHNGQFVAYHDNDSRFSASNVAANNNTENDNVTPNEDMGALLHKQEFKTIFQNNLNNDKLFTFKFKGQDWLAQTHSISFIQDNKAYLLIAVPRDSILGLSNKILRETMLILITVGILFIPLSWLFARALTRPLRHIAQQIKQVTALDVSETSMTTVSRVKEIYDLQLSTTKMRKTLDDFLRLLTMLSNERDIHSLLEKTCSKASAMLEADCAFVYLKSEHDKDILEPFILHTQDGVDADISLCPSLSTQWPYEKLRNNVNVKDIQFNLIHPMLKAALVKVGAHPKESNVYTLTIPLVDRSGNILGLLGFSYNECLGGDDLTHVMGVAKALSDFVSLSFEGQDLIAKQKNLLDSFIKLVANAIDTKSPYTGTHSQRVSELADMLANATSESTQAKFKQFKLDANSREQLNISAWLHDCGKITTPEYIIDKSTKLETIYNRINEIRMRFEVLIRDAQIQALQAISQGECAKQTNQILADNIQQIEADFTFIAECNLGEHFIDDEAIAKIEKISQQTWLRYLDDELGLSKAEIANKGRVTPITLPVREPMLINRSEHLLPHIESTFELETHLRFNMERPQHSNNLGELYNLMIQRGTLNSEERYIMNRHAIQTITMLEQLPFPSHLSRIPEIAGGHHEHLNGQGYPRGLQEEEISLEARILAVADVFEALTASDRPYKKAKSLSQTIKILSFMAKDRHIDDDLFKLFLSSGIYLEYAQQYLKPEQIDDVDISEYL